MSDTTTTTTESPDSGIVRLDDEEGVTRVLVDTLFGPWTTIDNDMTIPQCVDSADEAIAIIRARHAAWTPER